MNDFLTGGTITDDPLFLTTLSLQQQKQNMKAEQAAKKAENVLSFYDQPPTAQSNHQSSSTSTSMFQVIN